MSRILAIVAFLVVASSAVAAQLAVIGSARQPPITFYGLPVTILVQPVVQRANNQLGAPVSFVIEFQNVTDRPVGIYAFPPEVGIINRVDRQEVYSFPAGNQRVDLPPGDKISARFTWKQLDRYGVQVPPGHYDFTVHKLEFDTGTTDWNGTPSMPTNQSIFIEN